MHTPVPWKVGRWVKHGEDLLYLPIVAGEAIIASCNAVAPHAPCVEEIEQNAHLIVRAVNCHDDLLAALKELLEESYGEESSGITLARAAVAKAEETT